jgi:predicted nucleic acid-binding protein
VEQDRERNTRAGDTSGASPGGPGVNGAANGNGNGRHEPASEPQRGAAHPAAFVDSSALVALVDRDDATHGAAVEAYRGLVAAGYKLFTTNYVVAEAFDLLGSGLGTSVARQWLRDSRLPVYHADEQDEANARRLILRASDRRQISFTDAVSLVVMERLGVTDAFAVDPSFLAETA